MYRRRFRRNCILKKKDYVSGLWHFTDDTNTTSASECRSFPSNVKNCWVANSWIVTTWNSCSQMDSESTVNHART